MKRLKENNSQKGNAILIVVVAILILAALWYFFVYNKSGNLYQNLYPTGTTQPSPAALQNRNDLDSASAQLDGVNVNQMDSGINQVSADSSSF